MAENQRHPEEPDDSKVSPTAGVLAADDELGWENEGGMPIWEKLASDDRGGTLA
jgi:hypothetical protein